MQLSLKTQCNKFESMQALLCLEWLVREIRVILSRETLRMVAKGNILTSNIVQVIT